ncbi:MAG TPA: hypothetical protein VGK10_04355, partial [Prolixibacteraceae bacterium]
MKTKHGFLKWLVILLMLIASTTGAMAQTACPNIAKTFTVTPGNVGNTFNWDVSPGDPGVEWTISDAGTPSTIITFANPAISTIYTVTFMETDAVSGCSTTRTKSVTVNPLPIANIALSNGLDLSCTTPNTTLTASGGTSYSWSDGITVVGTSADLIVSTAGTFTVTVTNAGGCTDTESVTTTLNNTPPTASITNNTGATELTCTLTSISVTATGVGTYEWKKGTNVVGSAAGLSITTPGTYTVTVTGANGCTAVASITITENVTPPTAGITNNEATTVLT